MEFFSLKDKVAVVTGAGSGLGYATAKRFVDAGAKVVMADINDKTGELASDLGALFIRTDVSKEEQVEALMKGS
jgi:NAD(P)-dependent dehydrogenase (short-subunit alcohol dehydrogenase family)